MLCFPVSTHTLAREQLTHELKQQSYRKILSLKGIKKLKHNQNLFFENMVQVLKNTTFCF